MIKRFDRIDIATADLADAVSIYQKNLGFTAHPTGDSNEVLITLDDSEIRLRSGAAVADLISASGEGLAAIWLETEDLDQVAAQLKTANIGMSPIRVEADRRILEVNPAGTNMVPLFIFDRR